MSQPRQAVTDSRMPAELAEALAVAVVVLDPVELAIRYMNTAAEDLLGASRRRLTGVPLSRVVQPDGEWFERLGEVLNTDMPFSAREVLLSPLTGAPPRHVDLSATPWRGESGAQMLILECTAIDRHLRIARETALQAQEQASRSLLRGLAHEIRNPLAGLRGAAQLLERELTDPALHEYTQVIIHETDRLRNLVDRMVGPASPLKLESGNIHEITEHVVSLLRAEAPAGIRITTEYDPSLPDLNVDRDRLVQALLNLGRNALQATGDAGNITLRTSSLRQYTIGTMVHRLVVCVEVIDDGPGVPAALADNLFQPMVSGNAAGSGLGLSIAQSLARHHGGLIECESRTGHTMFRMYLPMETDHDQHG